jgi:hypothetical protein
VLNFKVFLLENILKKYFFLKKYFLSKKVNFNKKIKFKFSCSRRRLMLPLIEKMRKGITQSFEIWYHDALSL